MTESLNYLFEVLIDEDDDRQVSQNINKKYKISLSKSTSSQILVRAEESLKKISESYITSALVYNHYFEAEEAIATTKDPSAVRHGPFRQFISSPTGRHLWQYAPTVDQMPTRTPEALELLHKSPISWFKMLIPETDADKAKLIKMIGQSRYNLIVVAIKRIESALARVEQAKAEVEASKSRRDTEIIYADHCRYVTSPKSGKRYLIVGIDPYHRSNLSWDVKRYRDMKRHWTFNLRDFYTAPMSGKGLKSYTVPTNAVVMSPKYKHIFTIKAENIKSIDKQF